MVRGLHPGDDLAVALDLDDGMAEGLGARADALGAGLAHHLRELLVVDEVPALVGGPAMEPEAAPGDQRLLGAQVGKVEEGLEVNLSSDRGEDVKAALEEVGATGVKYTLVS